MDPLWLMFGSLICTLSALIFVEVRRIRRNLEHKTSEAASIKTVPEPARSA
jgi:hypothetical protein